MYRVVRDQSHAKEGYDVITFTSWGDSGFLKSPANRLMTGKQEIRNKEPRWSLGSICYRFCHSVLP
jgi:hypothetical protein